MITRPPVILLIPMKLFRLSYVVLGILGIARAFGFDFLGVFVSIALLCAILGFIVVVVMRRSGKFWLADAAEYWWDWIIHFTLGIGIFLSAWRELHWHWAFVGVSAMLALTIYRWSERWNWNSEPWSTALAREQRAAAARNSN